MELHPADPSTDNVYRFADAERAGPGPNGSDHSAATMKAAPVVINHGGRPGGSGAPAQGLVAGAEAVSPPVASPSVNEAGGGSAAEVPPASTPAAAPKVAKLQPRRRARVRLAYILRAWSFSLVVHAAILSVLAFATFSAE